MTSQKLIKNEDCYKNIKLTELEKRIDVVSGRHKAHHIGAHLNEMASIYKNCQSTMEHLPNQTLKE